MRIKTEVLAGLLLFFGFAGDPVKETLKINILGVDGI